jgi:sialate O-acetylesterase
VAGYGIRGELWYQGETNVPRAQQYRELLPALVADWRRWWDREDLAFYYVQIAPYAYPGDVGQAAELREAQALAQGLPGVGMVVTLDVGDPDDVHPRDKRTVGLRLASWALAESYGREGVACRSPRYVSMRVEGAAVRLAFDHAEGLALRGDAPAPFTVAGADRVFHPGTARVEGTEVVVTSEHVAAPVAVRYAWGAADRGVLFNGAGLPASSFRTDGWAPASRAR